MTAPTVTACPECGTQIAPGLVACPACGRLLHAEDLKRLAADAERRTQAGDHAGALAAWRAVVDLLPAGSRQHDVISERIAQLSRQVDAQGGRPAPAATARPEWAARAGLLGAVLLFLWKFKFLLAFILTKGKLLLLGLTKASTLFSMFLSLGLYAQVLGWPFAAGLIVSIYIHEMGHVAMLARFGIPATAPMFVPGLGAFIRTRYYPKDVVADARVGLAGPIWGLGAALTAYGAFRVTGAPLWGAIAQIGAWINLFNLLPVWQLDGAHAFRALASRQRWWVVGVIAAAWFVTSEGLLVLLLLAAGWAAWKGAAPERTDRRALIEYAVLIGALAALTQLRTPIS
jgi:Zn-dependent protease